MKKMLLATLTAAFVLPLSVFAQVAIPTNIQTDINQVTTLNTQIATLEQQRAAALSEITSALKQGSQGDQVKILQALLAADTSIYPEGLVSGFYGPMTAKAVKRFQQKYGLEGVGFLGPKTRGKLNELLKLTPIVFGTASTTATSTVFVVRGDEKKKNADNDNGQQKGEKKQKDDIRLCAMVAPGHLIAPGWLRKNKDDDHPVVPPCQFLPKGIEDKIENDNDDHRGPRDTAAPTISSISVSAATSSAVVTWSTNEFSNSSVVFGTTTAYGMTSSNNAPVLSHSVLLSGLAPATSYNYQIKSIDMAGNIATSSNLTFVTTALPDTTAPAVSGISTSVGTTTATVSWTTSEAAASKFYYGTSTPLSLAAATLIGDPTFLSTHSVPLTGLTASTTYYFLVNAVDLAGNSATSTEQLFVTAH